VGAADGEDHRATTLAVDLQSWVDHVPAFDRDVTLSRHACAAQPVSQEGRLNAEPGSAGALNGIAGRRQARRQLTPDLAIDELRLLHPVVAGIEQERAAILLQRRWRYHVSLAADDHAGKNRRSTVLHTVDVGQRPDRDSVVAGPRARDVERLQEVLRIRRTIGERGLDGDRLRAVDVVEVAVT